MWWKWLLVFIIAYLLGSIPAAYILVRKSKGVDIRNFGSGNVGSTNAVRVAGKRTGLLVFVVDAGKGALAAALGLWLGGAEAETMAILAGFCAFIGHLFPVWLKFKGGKGIATAIGVAAVLTPSLALITFAAWVIVLLVAGYVSLASCAGGVVLTLSSLISAQYWLYTLIFALITVIAIYRHRGNFAKIKAGTEDRSFRRN